MVRRNQRRLWSARLRLLHLFALLDRDGARIGDEVPLAIEASSEGGTIPPFGTSSSPTLAWNGAAWGASWSAEQDDDREIFFLPLGPSGLPGELLRVTSSDGRSVMPTVVPSGDAFAVVWADDTGRMDFAADIYYVRLCPDPPAELDQ